MKTTIFFDLGNVLINHDRYKAIQALARFIPAAPEQLERNIDMALEHEFEVGQYTISEYIAEINTRYQPRKPITQADLLSVWALSFWPNHPVCDLLDSLKSQAQLVLLSNTNALHYQAILKHYGSMLSKLDDRVLSYEVGARKPQPKIYQAALDQARTTARQALFIDDLAENIQAAEAMGITCLHYKSYAQLTGFLTQNGFKLAYKQAKRER